MSTETAGDLKRQELRERIAAGEERNSRRDMIMEKAIEARDSAVDFTKKHPVGVIAGALAIGLAIGAMTPRGRKLSKKAGKQASVFATLAAEAATVFALDLMEKAGDAAIVGKDRLEDMSDSIAASARTARNEIGYKAGAASNSIRSISQDVSRKSARKIRDLRKSVTH